MRTIEEMIAVMTAFKEGKEIEFLGGIGRWLPASNPLWNWETTTYRVKPEPKYRPYASIDECFADVKKHSNWIKHSVTEAVSFIAGVNPDCAISGNNVYGYDELLDSYVWADDNSPCGVLED